MVTVEPVYVEDSLTQTQPCSLPTVARHAVNTAFLHASTQQLELRAAQAVEAAEIQESSLSTSIALARELGLLETQPTQLQSPSQPEHFFIGEASQHSAQRPLSLPCSPTLPDRVMATETPKRHCPAPPPGLGSDDTSTISMLTLLVKRSETTEQWQHQQDATNRDIISKITQLDSRVATTDKELSTLKADLPSEVTRLVKEEMQKHETASTSSSSSTRAPASVDRSTLHRPKYLRIKLCESSEADQAGFAEADLRSMATTLMPAWKHEFHKGFRSDRYYRIQSSPTDGTALTRFLQKDIKEKVTAAPWNYANARVSLEAPPALQLRYKTFGDLMRLLDQAQLQCAYTPDWQTFTLSTTNGTRLASLPRFSNTPQFEQEFLSMTGWDHDVAVENFAFINQ